MARWVGHLRAGGRQAQHSDRRREVRTAATVRAQAITATHPRLLCRSENTKQKRHNDGESGWIPRADADGQRVEGSGRAKAMSEPPAAMRTYCRSSSI